MSDLPVVIDNAGDDDDDGGGWEKSPNSLPRSLSVSRSKVMMVVLLDLCFGLVCETTE